MGWGMWNGTGVNGSDPGWWTVAQEASVEMNFTGTGLTFDLTLSDPSKYETIITINSTVPPASAISNDTSVSSLPWGRHMFRLNLTRVSSNTSQSLTKKSDRTQRSDVDHTRFSSLPKTRPYSHLEDTSRIHNFDRAQQVNDESDFLDIGGSFQETDLGWAKLNGVVGQMGSSQTSGSRNETIDDTAWRDWRVVLTPGWNMLEGPTGASNWIDNTDVQNELPTLSNDYNSSISFTSQPDAATTILFSGSAFWAYGISGPEEGTYEVGLDGQSQGVFNASTPQRVYSSVLFHTSGLKEGNHSVVLKNKDGRLSFDKAVIWSGLTFAPIVNTNTSSTPVSTPSSTPNAIVNHRLDIPAIAGISAGAAALILLVLLWAIWACVRRRRRSFTAHQADPKMTTFWRWSANKSKTSSNFFRLATPTSATFDPHFRFPSPSSLLYPHPQTFPINTNIFNGSQKGKSFFKFSSPVKTPTSLPDTIISEVNVQRSNHPFRTHPSGQITNEVIEKNVISRMKGAEVIVNPLDGGNINRMKSFQKENTLSPAISTALSGQTNSPLTQLRLEHDESYFPKMKSKASISSKMTFGMSELGGILDGYKITSIDRNDKNDLKAFLDQGPPEEIGKTFVDLEQQPSKKRFFGKSEGRPKSSESARMGGKGYF
ncbi:hypothetical protein M231_00906 [Tremella mesenterica]|uniref:Uncharacterized protein n=1 Tax=Tremella mesenterica TaxID=5217 RepID=A0A4Q1BUA0_TREME|nr:hypothetical protein M231_00906 [Tremella mesenterica]